MTIENTIKNFASNLGNGAKMGEHLAVAIDHVIENRDTTPIVKMINAAKRKGDTQAERMVKFTFGNVYVGAKITKTKTGISIKIKDQPSIFIYRGSFCVQMEKTFALNYGQEKTMITKCLYDNGSIFYDVGSFYLGIVELFGDMPCDMQTMFALFLIGASGLGVLYFIILMMKRMVRNEY